jgi:hypothetical protein
MVLNACKSDILHTIEYDACSSGCKVQIVYCEGGGDRGCTKNGDKVRKQAVL